MPELRLECRKAGLCGYSKLRKAELIKCLTTPKIEQLSLRALKERCVDLGLPSVGSRGVLVNTILFERPTQILPDEVIAHIGSFLTGTYAFSTFAVLSRSVLWHMMSALQRHKIALGVMRVGKPGPRASAWLFDYQDEGEVAIELWRAYIDADYTRIHLCPPHLVLDEDIAVSVLSKKTSGGHYHIFPEPKSHRVRLAAIAHNPVMLMYVPAKDITDELLVAACTTKPSIVPRYLDVYRSRCSNPTFLAKILAIPRLPEPVKQSLAVTIPEESTPSVPYSLYAQTLLENVAAGVTHRQLLAAVCQNHTTLRSHHKLYSEALSDKAFLDVLYKTIPTIKSLYPDLLG